MPFISPVHYTWTYRSSAQTQSKWRMLRANLQKKSPDGGSERLCLELLEVSNPVARLHRLLFELESSACIVIIHIYRIQLSSVSSVIMLIKAFAKKILQKNSDFQLLEECSMWYRVLLSVIYTMHAIDRTINRLSFDSCITVTYSTMYEDPHCKFLPQAPVNSSLYIQIRHAN
jgi:hypothetical protein